MEQAAPGDRRRSDSPATALAKFFSSKMFFTIASIVFAAGVLWQKVEATEKRLDRLEGIILPAGRPAAPLPAASPATAVGPRRAAPGIGPAGLFLNVRNFIWRF